jgi:hypothetical protein
VPGFIDRGEALRARRDRAWREREWGLVGQNILQDAANTLPRMIMSERMGFPDLEMLAGLPDGTLSIDLLAGEAVHSAGQPAPLQIVQHLAEWLVDRLGSRGVSLSDLAEARLELAFRTDAVPTDRARAILFDWTSTCTLAVRDGKIGAGRASGRMWYDRDKWRP